MTTSDWTISFTHDELMSLCNAYITNTAIHRAELAMIFTKFFPVREEPYLLDDVRSIFQSKVGLYHNYIFKRNGLDMLSPDEMKDFLEDGFSEEEMVELEALHVKWTPIDPAFHLCLSENRFEFDVIPEVVYSLYIFPADIILRLFVQYDITLKSFEGLSKLDTETYKDIKFFFNTYADGLSNKKNIEDEIKKKYKQITALNLQQKKKVATLYLIGGTDLLLVKHQIIRFYLDYYDEFKSFNEWYEKVEAVIITYMPVLLPKMQYLFNRIDAKAVQDKRKELAKYVERSFNEIHKHRVLSKRLLAREAEAKLKDFGCGFDICDPEHCKAFHKRKNEFQKRPGLHFVITKCNQLRRERLECLRKYFALGSFKKQSAFAKSLKENLRPLANNVGLLFEDEEGFKQIADVYHRGLLRYFWKYENQKQMKLDYEELCQYIQADKLFHKDGDVVRIKFNALDEEGWWVDSLLSLEYRPAHSQDNYNKLIETLFGNRKCVRVGNRDIGVHVVLFLIMFYYWIYLSIKDESAEDIRLYSRCVCHKVIPEQ